jgi:hypothetical protein
MLMVDKPRNKPNPSGIHASSDALRILASLIAQSHFKKIQDNTKNIHSSGNGDIGND